MKYINLGLCCLVLLVGSATQGCAMNQKQSEDVLTVQGTIRVVGNEPFTHVVISAPDDAAGKSGAVLNWLITGPLAGELRTNYQFKSIILEGTACTSSSPEFKKCLNALKIIRADDKK